jgi:hypothetical protein
MTAPLSARAPKQLLCLSGTAEERPLVLGIVARAVKSKHANA